MPSLIAVAGGLVTDWIEYGNGMEHIDQALRDRGTVRRRKASEVEVRSAPLEALRHPADMAGLLLTLVARQRGLPTPEQGTEILSQMRAVTEPGDDLDTRMAVIRHAAEQAPDADTAIRSLGPRLRDGLSRSERHDLADMLRAVATVHRGPTETQERFIEQVRRVIAEDR